MSAWTTRELTALAAQRALAKRDGLPRPEVVSATATTITLSNGVTIGQCQR